MELHTNMGPARNGELGDKKWKKIRFANRWITRLMMALWEGENTFVLFGPGDDARRVVPARESVEENPGGGKCARKGKKKGHRRGP